MIDGFKAQMRQDWETIKAGLPEAPKALIVGALAASAFLVAMLLAAYVLVKLVSSTSVGPLVGVCLVICAVAIWHDRSR